MVRKNTGTEGNKKPELDKENRSVKVILPFQKHLHPLIKKTKNPRRFAGDWVFKPSEGNSYSLNHLHTSLDKGSEVLTGQEPLGKFRQVKGLLS